MGCDMLSKHELDMLNRWAEGHFKLPSIFRLLVVIAQVQSREAMASVASTEHLVACSSEDPGDVRAEVFRLLKRAWEMGLLQRKGEPNRNVGYGSIWTLTADGRRFLVNGLRSRLNMQKVSKLTRTQICDTSTEDEITELEYELRERSRLIEATSQAHQMQRLDGSGRRNVSRIPSKIIGEPMAFKAVSRKAVANALHEYALLQARNRQPEIGPLWAGLVRQ